MTSDGGTDAPSFGSPSERVSVDGGWVRWPNYFSIGCVERVALSLSTERVGSQGWYGGENTEVFEIVSVEENRRAKSKITVLDGKESRRRVPHQQAVAG